MSDNSLDMNPIPISQIPSPNDALFLEWCAVIGFFTVSWSPIERSIDQCFHMLRDLQKANSGGCAKTNQRAKKIEFIKQSLEILPDFGHLLENYPDLISKTDEIAEIRNILIHGLIESWTCSGITISKIQKSNEEHLREIFHFSMPQLASVQPTFTAVSDQWNEISEELRLKNTDKGKG